MDCGHCADQPGGYGCRNSNAGFHTDADAYAHSHHNAGAADHRCADAGSVLNAGRNDGKLNYLKRNAAPDAAVIDTGALRC